MTTAAPAEAVAGPAVAVVVAGTVDGGGLEEEGEVGPPPPLADQTDSSLEVKYLVKLRYLTHIACGYLTGKSFDVARITRTIRKYY